MKEITGLAALSDNELLHRLAALLHDSRCTEADLVAHIGEVDARRLYAREAAPSMFSYCTQALHLSGAEAYLRITVARAARGHPLVLAMLADGRLHLSAIAKLARHLTTENRDAILKRATHRSKREIGELIAEISPRPDAPSLVRKLPTVVRRQPAQHSSSRTGSPTNCESPRNPAVAPPCLSGYTDTDNPQAGAISAPDELRPDGAGGRMESPQRAVVEPLAPSRYKVQFTASADLRDKLERLQALLRSEVPDADLAIVIDRAVSEALERLEARRYGKRATQSQRTTTKHSAIPGGPTPPPTQPTRAPRHSRHIPALSGAQFTSATEGAVTTGTKRVAAARSDIASSTTTSIRSAREAAKHPRTCA